MSMNNFGRAMSRRTVMAIQTEEVLKKLGRAEPLDYDTVSVEKNWKQCGDYKIFTERLNEMRNGVTAFSNKVIETWKGLSILELEESNGKILDENKIRLKANLYDQLTRLVGKDNAENWSKMSNDDIWEISQDICETNHLYYRQRYEGTNFFVCINYLGQAIKQEKNLKRSSMMSINAYRRNTLPLIMPPEGRTRAELHGMKAVCLAQQEAELKSMQCTNVLLKNIDIAIAIAEKDMNLMSLGSGDEKGDKANNEDVDEITKLLRELRDEE